MRIKGYVTKNEQIITKLKTSQVKYRTCHQQIKSNFLSNFFGSLHLPNSFSILKISFQCCNSKHIIIVVFLPLLLSLFHILPTMERKREYIKPFTFLYSHLQFASLNPNNARKRALFCRFSHRELRQLNKSVNGFVIFV